MKYEYDIIVIGAGSAGLVTASASLTLGAKVAIVEAGEMGGDCLNTGCVPSKALLKSAHLARDIQRAQQFGITAAPTIDFAVVKDHVKRAIATIAPHDSVERFEKMGATVIKSRGQLIDAHTVQTDRGRITANKIVIATGSRPNVPPIAGLADANYYTNETIFDIKRLPEHLIVLGGGPIGLELGQGFCHMGSQVTVIDRNASLFTKDEPEVAPLMSDVLRRDGLNLKLNAGIEQVTTRGNQLVVTIALADKRQEIVGDALLVSLGRRPNTENMGLTEVGVKLNKRGYIETSDGLQTDVPSIYACGDVVGPYQFTHMAGYQAAVVTRNMIFPFNQRVNYQAVPWTTYTKPAVAHVGALEGDLKKNGRAYQALTVDLADNDRAVTDGHHAGFLKLLLDNKSRVIGATIVAEAAADLILPASIAINNKLTLAKLTQGIVAYPSEGEIYNRAATEHRKASFKPWMKQIIQKLLLRH